MRLDRFLSGSGVGSRKDVQKLIRAGRVSLDGLRTTDPGAGTDGKTVTLDGKTVQLQGRIHLMVNKPAGVLTAREDPRQPTVMDLLPPEMSRAGCMPVGRLDKDTTGLLVLTTDGVLAHRLISPKRHVDKVYLAEVEGHLTEETVERFARGVPLKDFTALPARLEILGAALGKVTVQEGKYHQVKRMFGACGCPVVRLHRAVFGPLELDGALSPGEWRRLTPRETEALYEAAGMEVPL